MNIITYNMHNYIITYNMHYYHYIRVLFCIPYMLDLVLGLGLGIIFVLPAVHEARATLLQKSM